MNNIHRTITSDITEHFFLEHWRDKIVESVYLTVVSHTSTDMYDMFISFRRGALEQLDVEWLMGDRGNNVY